MVALFKKILDLKLPRMPGLPRMPELPRWKRAALGVLLSVVVLVPGMMVVRRSEEPEPVKPVESVEPVEFVEEATTAREVASIASLPESVPEFETSLDALPPPDPASAEPERATDPMLVPDGTLEGDLAALPPTPVDDGDLPEPIEVSTDFEVSTDWEAAAATELLWLETSTSADGNRSLILLRANGSISNPEVFTIADPDRLVIDLPGMVSAMESSHVSVDSSRVARVRVGEHEGKVRVVLDAASGADGFEERLVEPASDGLLITLGSQAELAGPLAEAAAELQPPAAIGPPDAPEAVQPAREGHKLPLYLRADKTAQRDPKADRVSEDRYDCIIEPSELVEVGSALTAIVESVSVERSDFVEKGQVLAQLEAAPERAAAVAASARASMSGEVLASRAKMELGTSKRKRADQLFEGNALSVDTREEVRTEARVAKATLQEAREYKELMRLEHQASVERLKEHTILSPVSGVVVERLKSPGEVVKEETIVVLAQIDPLRVEVVLPAALFGSLEPGMRAEVTPELPEAGVQVASVTIVDRVVDATSGTFGVRLELLNADHAVPSGLRCGIRFLQVD